MSTAAGVGHNLCIKVNLGSRMLIRPLRAFHTSVTLETTYLYM